MSIETEIVDISITQDSAAVQRSSFGIPLILSHTAPWSERVRYYSGLDEVALDFVSSSPERRGANSLFSQELKPTKIAIGRATNNVPTLQYTFAVTTPRNSDTRSYKINVVGQGVTDTTVAYTSDASAAAEEIHDGLVTALNAVASKNYTAAFASATFTAHTFTAANASEIFTSAAHGLKTGDGPMQVTNAGGALPTGLALVTDYFAIVLDANTFKLATTRALALAGTNLLISTDGTGVQTITGTAGFVRPFSGFTVTANSPGAWFGLELVDITAMSCALTHTGDPTTDLDAIELEDPTFYVLLTHFNSKTYVQNVATWIEAHTKLYIFDVPETEAINTASNVGTDTLQTLHAALFARSAGMYHHKPAIFAPHAWAGDVLPIDPGGETWALKPLVGLGIASKLSTTNRANLVARNASFVVVGFGKNITIGGTTFDGDFIDVTRGLDWLDDDMTKGIGGVLTSVRKVPFSNPGITLVVNQIRASLDRAVQRGILRGVPKISAPDVDAIDPVSRGQRLLPDVKFDGLTEGAIHKVGVRGRISL